MSDVEPPFSLPPAPPPPIECWRCGKSYDAAASECSYCRAAAPRTSGVVVVATRTQPVVCDDPWSPVVKLIVYYAVLLATSIVFGLIYRVRFESAHDLTRTDRIWLLQAMLVMEIIDTIIIVAAWRSLGRPSVSYSGVSRPLAWGAAAPGLALLLALNYVYHFVLSQFVPTIDDPERLLSGYELLHLASYCVQPAIIEELFFRGLVLDWFRTSMTTRGALVVSSVMFGMVHIYAPASVPYLVVAGLVLGGARIMSNGLVLPMILHFLHNLFVTLYQHYLA